MELIICESGDQVDASVSNWCEEKILDLGIKSAFIPAGGTPTGLYRLWEKQKPKYLRGLKLVQIDDVLSSPQEGVFKKFFEEHLPSYKDQLCFIESGDCKAELGLLGLGVNGHVAFHEPGLPQNFYSGCVKLDDVTCKNLNLPEGSWGVSYGAGAFMRCKAVSIIVKGKSKRDILARLLKKDPSVPASALMNHPRLTIITDREAYPA